MASVVAFLKSYQLTATLVDRLVEAWISERIKEITDSADKKNAARKSVINAIEEARRDRNTEKLIALNHALAIVERGRLE